MERSYRETDLSLIKEVLSNRTAQGNSNFIRHGPRRFLDVGRTQRWQATDGVIVIGDPCHSKCGVQT